MFFLLINFVFSEIFYERIYLTNLNEIQINNSYFYNGGLKIISSNCKTILNNNIFINCYINNDFGIVKIEVFSSITIYCCFLNSTSNQNSIGISQYSSINQKNFLNFSIFNQLNGGNSGSFSWNLQNGINIVNNINVSNCFSTSNREIGGHFGGGISGYSLFHNYFKNYGSSIYGPYLVSGLNQYHENLNFINNSIFTYGIILYWDGNHILKNSIFNNNNGIPLFKSTLYSHNGFISLENCFFDILNIGNYK